MIEDEVVREVRAAREAFAAAQNGCGLARVGYRQRPRIGPVRTATGDHKAEPTAAADRAGF